MPSNSEANITKTDDVAQLIDPRGKKHIVQLTESGKLQTNHGQLFHRDLIEPETV